MKPLVNYCRWHGARLRLRGRDPEAVWGHLVFQTKDGQEEEWEFRFHLADSLLTMQSRDGEKQILLDEMGVPLNDDK
jgi:hypothetical protein